MQADMIRNNTDSLRELGASAWSLTSPKPWNIDNDAEGVMDTSGEHWNQYPEPINLVTPDVTHGKSADDWNINSSRRWTNRVRQMDSQVVSTHKVLDRLRDDYAELARNVSRIEQRTREAAASVHTLMGQYTGSESPRKTVSSMNSYVSSKN
ncbi:hypothetical protein FBUS_03905 [Fasciolopsis buskii]|uniref:Uncharacterized protein n=1 Tax=Fasciolopsis buskii TaxID=27845 RepID=A0A8E0RL67_9TREM|nr:hypothetical protein FBUS_03905 [Fasciolopsis buski]